jgi:hypothetical protein
MMKRETLQAEKSAARKMDYHPQRQFVHSVVDSHLEALDLLDGGTTAANRTAEVRKGLADVRTVLTGRLDRLEQAETYVGLVDEAAAIRKAVFMLDVISREMLSSDYRRYPTWADQQPRIAEEFGA